MSKVFIIRPSHKLVWLPFRTHLAAGAELGLTTVPASAVGPDNLGGRITFDDTVANFDIDVFVQTLTT